MTEPTTHTLDVPGAVLTYDVRENASSTEPALLMIGLPMGAAGFGNLAGYFPDRTVVTYDPRGADRSKRTDDTTPTTPDEHADDVHRLISALGKGPVDLFASSGGAVVALALVARHPEDVRTLVAHEPPNANVLSDRKEALAAAKGIHELYQRSGWGAAMAKFIGLVGFQGPIPAGWIDLPGPGPADMGMPTEDDGKRNDALLGQTLVGTTHYQFDFDALKKAPTRIVVAAGEESEGVMASRAAYVVAERLGKTVAVFPSHHGGFLGDEQGYPGKPKEFAARLREVLAADG